MAVTGHDQIYDLHDQDYYDEHDGVSYDHQYDQQSFDYPNHYEVESPSHQYDGYPTESTQYPEASSADPQQLYPQHSRSQSLPPEVTHSLPSQSRSQPSIKSRPSQYTPHLPRNNQGQSTQRYHSHDVNSGDEMDPFLVSLITLHSFRNGGQLLPPSSQRARSTVFAAAKVDRLTKKFLDRLAELLSMSLNGSMVVTALVEHNVWIAVDDRGLEERHEIFLRRLEEFQTIVGQSDQVNEQFWRTIIDYAQLDLSHSLLPNTLSSLNVLLTSPFDTKHPTPIIRALLAFYNTLSRDTPTPTEGNISEWTSSIITTAYEFSMSQLMREYFQLHQKEKPFLKLWENVCALSRLRGAFQTFLRVLPYLEGLQIHVVPPPRLPSKPPPLTLEPLLALLSLPPTIQTVHKYINRAASSFPFIAQRFETTLSLPPRVHPEINIFFFISSRIPVSQSHTIFPYLGTSSPSCALCSQFINASGDVPTRGTTGKVHSGWSLPANPSSAVEGVSEVLDDITDSLAQKARVPITNGLGTITESASGFGETIGTGTPLSFSTLDSSNGGQGQANLGKNGGGNGNGNGGERGSKGIFGRMSFGRGTEKMPHIDVSFPSNSSYQMPSAVREVEQDLRNTPNGRGAVEFPPFPTKPSTMTLASGGKEKDFEMFPEDRISMPTALPQHQNYMPLIAQQPQPPQPPNLPPQPQTQMQSMPGSYGLVEDQAFIPEGRASNYFVSTPVDNTPTRPNFQPQPSNINFQPPLQREFQQQQQPDRQEDSKGVWKRVFGWGRKRKNSSISIPKEQPVPPAGILRQPSVSIPMSMPTPEIPVRRNSLSTSMSAAGLKRPKSRPEISRPELISTSYENLHMPNAQLGGPSSVPQGQLPFPGQGQMQMPMPPQMQSQMQYQMPMPMPTGYAPSAQYAAMMDNGGTQLMQTDSHMLNQQQEQDARAATVITHARTTSDEILRAYKEGASIHSEELKKINTAFHSYNQAAERVKDVQTNLLESVAKLYQLMQQSQGHKGREYQVVMDGVKTLTRELEMLKGTILMMEMEREERRLNEKEEKRQREIEEREKEERVQREIEERKRKEDEIQNEVERLEEEVRAQRQGFTHPTPRGFSDVLSPATNISPGGYRQTDNYRQDYNSPHQRYDVQAEEHRQRKLALKYKKQELYELMQQIIEEKQELEHLRNTNAATTPTTNITPMTPEEREVDVQRNKNQDLGFLKRAGKALFGLDTSANVKMDRERSKSLEQERVPKREPSLNLSLYSDRPFNLDEWINQAPLPNPLPRAPPRARERPPQRPRKLSSKPPISGGIGGGRKRKVSLRGLFAPSGGADARAHAERWGKTYKEPNVGETGAQMVQQLKNRGIDGQHGGEPEYTEGSLLYRSVKPTLKHYSSVPVPLKEMRDLTTNWMWNHYRLSSELEGVTDPLERRRIVERIMGPNSEEMIDDPTETNGAIREEPVFNSNGEEKFKEKADWNAEDFDSLIEEFNRLSTIEHIANNIGAQRTGQNHR